MPEGALLEVRDLHAWYGESHILHGMDFEVRQGEVVTLLGRNGAGKTTTLKSVMGMVQRRRGSVSFEGHQLIMLPSNRIARLGLAFCPEERGIFAGLNVKENLLLPPEIRRGGLLVDTIFGLFPNLKERLRSQGTKLSGGSFAPEHGFFYWMSRPRGWRLSSSSRSAPPSGVSRPKDSPSCSSSRTSASRRGWRTATTSSSGGGWWR